MFDRFKRKSIEIICPACKGGQTEPALAFSTYCRTCNVHLKIVKGVARISAGPVLSGVSTVREVSYTFDRIEPSPEQDKNGADENQNGSENPENGADAWVKSKNRPEKNKGRRKGKGKRTSKKAQAKDQVEVKQPKEEKEEPEEHRPVSMAEVFGLKPEGEESESGDETAREIANEPGGGTINLGDQAVSYNDLTSGSMGAMITDLVDQEEKREQAKAARPNAESGEIKKQEEEEEELEVASDGPTNPIAAAASSLVKPLTSSKGKAKEKKTEAPEPGILHEPKKPVAVKKSEKEVSKTHVRVRCFRCHHRQWDSKYAESTQCGRCNTYISLANYSIRRPTDRVIRTRGNVTVHRKGSLVGSELACRDLLAMGSISTKVDCSGEARFRHSATVSGHLYCETLIVEKGTIVEFTDGVHTESAQIHGTLRGDLTCAGVVEVSRTGILDGDVEAHVVDLHDGATLTGDLMVNPELKMKLPVVKGYDPSIID